MLVDNAIVILESIDRTKRTGLSLIQPKAALKGATEV